MSNLLSQTLRDDSPAARGRRFKLLRGMLGLTRNQMADKIGYSRASISYWENATYNGLMLAGAEKATSLARESGVFCHTEWLMSGLGQSPYFISGGIPGSTYKQTPVTRSAFSLSDEEKTLRDKEVTYFKRYHPESVVIEVADMNMAPLYVSGQLVGGVWQAADIIMQECNAIIEVNGILQLRRLRKSGQEGLWDLAWLQLDRPGHDSLELIGVELVKIAPIIRVWG